MNILTQSILTCALSFFISTPSVATILVGERLIDMSFIKEKIDQVIFNSQLEELFKENPVFVCENYHCSRIKFLTTYDDVNFAWTILHGEMFVAFMPLCLDCYNKEQRHKAAKALMDQIKRRFPDAETSDQIIHKPWK